MTYEIEYFNPRILANIEAWPEDILADYAKLVELLFEHGPSLRMPHSRSLGDGLFELRPRGREGIGNRFIALSLESEPLSFTLSSKRRSRHPSRI